MKKLNKLLSLCKCGLTIRINEHKNYYETIEQYFNDTSAKEDISLEMMQEMIKRNSVIEIYAYVRTPVSCLTVYHYDLEKAIDIAIHEITN